MMRKSRKAPTRSGSGLRTARRHRDVPQTSVDPLLVPVVTAAVEAAARAQEEVLALRDALAKRREEWQAELPQEPVLSESDEILRLKLALAEAQEASLINLPPDARVLMGQLREERQRAERLEVKYKKVLASTSWRLTAPLRAVITLLRGNRQQGR